MSIGVCTPGSGKRIKPSGSRNSPGMRLKLTGMEDQEGAVIG